MWEPPKKKNKESKELVEKNLSAIRDQLQSTTPKNHPLGLPISLDTGVGFRQPPAFLLATLNSLSQSAITSPNNTINNYSEAGLNHIKTSVASLCNRNFNAAIAAEHVLLDYGSSALFSKILKQISRTEGDTVIHIVPCYGKFIEYTEKSSLKTKASLFALSKEDDWKLNPDKLENFIKKTNEELFQTHKNNILIEYQILLLKLKQKKINYPIPSLSEENLVDRDTLLSTLANINQQLAKIYSLVNVAHQNNPTKYFHIASQDMLYLHLPSVVGIVIANPSNPFGEKLSVENIQKLLGVIEKFPEVSIIEDKAFFGSSYDEQDTATFTHKRLLSTHRFYILFSLSKMFHCASIRASFCLSSTRNVALIEADNENNGIILSPLNFSPLVALANSNEDLVKKYLEDTNNIYQLHRDLIIAIVEGIQSFKDSKRKQQIIDCYTKIKKENNISADGLMKGIEKITLLNKPSAGFFLVLDLSQLTHKYLGDLQLTYQTLGFLFKNNGLRGIHGHQMGMPDQPLLRITFTVEPLKIIQWFQRLKKILDLVSDEPMLIKQNTSSRVQLIPNTSIALSNRSPISGNQALTHLLSAEINLKLGNISKLEEKYTEDEEITLQHANQKARILFESLTHPEDFSKSVNDQFDLSEGTINISAKEFCNSFSKIMGNFVQNEITTLPLESDNFFHMLVISECLRANNPFALERFFQQTQKTDLLKSLDKLFVEFQRSLMKSRLEIYK